MAHSDLIIHGGSPKTGTSFLQVLLARNAEHLFDAGVYYPHGKEKGKASSGQITSGNGVEMANYIRPNLPHNISDKSAFLDQFKTDLNNAKGRNVLYSSEFLILVPNKKTATILDIARQYGYRTRYVYFVRNIGTAIASGYSQAIKRRGETRSFNDFIHESRLGYGATIRRACAVLGPENVEVYNYEEHRSALAEFFFKSILGMDFFPDEKASVNRSLTIKELEFQRIMNMAAPKNRKFSDFVSEALLSVSPGNSDRLTITRKEADILAERFRDDVDFVNEKVRGKPICIADHVVPDRVDATLTDFERSAAAVLARIAKAVVKNT